MKTTYMDVDVDDGIDNIDNHNERSFWGTFFGLNLPHANMRYGHTEQESRKTYGYFLTSKNLLL